MAVCLRRKKMVEDSVDCDVVVLLSRMIRARIYIDFNFLQRN